MENSKLAALVINKYCSYHKISANILFNTAKLIIELDKHKAASTLSECVVLISENYCDDSCYTLASNIKERYGDSLRLIYFPMLESFAGYQGTDKRSLFSAQYTLPLSYKSLMNAFTIETDQIPFPNNHTKQQRSATQSLSILIAEDTEINARVIFTFLKKAGHNPVHVINGTEALKALQENHFDMVLMDMRMPEMDGIEATERWRAMQPENDTPIPIIALTANATPADKKKCFKVGMDDFLTKPVNQEQLEKLINQLQSEGRITA